MTLAQWFKQKTGMTLTEYKRKINDGDIESGVYPEEIKLIWDAALSFGDVPKVKQTDLRPFRKSK